MSFSFLLQELHQKAAEKIKAAKAHRKIMAVVIAAVLVTIVFFVIKANTAQSPAAVTAAPASGTAQSVQSAALSGRNQSETARQTKTLKRIENVASILGIAVLTSGGMIIYYQKKKNRVAPLPVLRSEGDTH